MSPRLDGVRLSDLSVWGWLALLAAPFVALFTLVKSLNVALFGGPAAEAIIGAVVTVVLLAIAYDGAAPEVEGTCANCGTTVRTQANRDGVDEIVTVESSGSPRRISLGPLSAVVETVTDEWTYCSGDCAHADRERRALIARPDGRELRVTADRSVSRPAATAATDGAGQPSDDRREQIVDVVEEHGSGAVRDEALLKELTTGSDRNRPHEA